MIDVYEMIIAAEVESMREFHERWRGSISGQADKYRGTQP